MITAYAEAASRQRERDAGLTPGILTPGPCNALTDVSGVLVGHRTLNPGALHSNWSYRHP